MIIPIRCFTCNKLIADKYQYYLEKKEEIDKVENESDKIITTNLIESGEVKKTKYGLLLDELGLYRYCCRRMMLCQVDIINVL
tara:strand:+ start:50 stop:298 length:249 start_codon:yes stop_codon:yes gene_type:complete